MNEWKKQVEEKARWTAIEYVLEGGSSRECGRKTSAKEKTGKSSGFRSDFIYGCFALFMSIAMALISVGFYALSSGGSAREELVAAAVYLALCFIMLVSGLCSIAGGCSKKL